MTACAHCGGRLLWDPLDREWRCLNCGRGATPPRWATQDDKPERRRKAGGILL